VKSIVAEESSFSNVEFPSFDYNRKEQILEKVKLVPFQDNRCSIF